MKYLALPILILAALTLNQCKDKESPTNPDLDPREKMLNDYQTNYIGSALTSVGWTGNSSSCSPGTVSAEAHAKVLQRINFFRRQVGLNDNITLDTAKNRKCQEAALMMMANGSLNHTPPNTWKCYTADGAAAAGASNLSSGSHSVNAVSGQMADNGSNNTACGHRRWILYSRAQVMGHGSTSSNQALWVIGGAAPSNPPNMPEFISWPPQGYVASTLVYARWSFSLPGADFTDTEVEMKRSDGLPVTLKIVHTNGGYGDRSIVWEPTGITPPTSADITWVVTVKNVKLSSGTLKTYSYKVTVVKV